MQTGITVPSMDSASSEDLNDTPSASADPAYQVMLDVFRKHMESEIDAIGDKTLEKELQSINNIISAAFPNEQQVV